MPNAAKVVHDSRLKLLTRQQGSVISQVGVMTSVPVLFQVLADSVTPRVTVVPIAARASYRRAKHLYVRFV